MLRAVTQFGAPVAELGIREEDFASPGLVAQFGLPPYRIDVLTAVSGVTFAEAWPDRLDAHIAGVMVPVIGREAFIRNKQASGRTKDMADIESLAD